MKILTMFKLFFPVIFDSDNQTQANDPKNTSLKKTLVAQIDLWLHYRYEGKIGDNLSDQF